MTAIVNNNELHGDNHGLPDREVVRQAQRAFSLSAEFWTLIKHGRIPYKIVDGQLVEANYPEVRKCLMNKSSMPLYWMTDVEVESSKESAEAMDKALKVAQAEKEKLDKFRRD